MKTFTFSGEYAAGRLVDELRAAGIDAVVQVDENAVIAIEEPVLDDQYEFVLDDHGNPVLELRWYRLDADREPLDIPRELIPPGATNGVHVQIGPPTLTVSVAGNVSEAQVRKVVESHDPTPPPAEPSLEERIAALEAALHRP